jgi:ABC-type phosphate transport system substrate-binding protein
MKRFLRYACLFLAAASVARAQKTVVIVNRSTHVEQMSAAEVRDIFTGSSTRFRNGTSAVSVVLQGGSEQDSFLKEFIGKLDSGFRIGWRSLVFSGQATMVKTVENDAAMLAFVARTPGAIGYVPKTAERDNVTTVIVR